VWRGLRRQGEPPATRLGVLLAGREVTVIDNKARRESGYAPKVTVERGLAELRGA